MASSNRDVATQLWHYLPTAPRTEAEVRGRRFASVIIERYPMKDRDAYYKRYPVTIVDARTHLPGGKEAWKFEEHGFCYVKAPEPVPDFKDRKHVDAVYGPRVLERVQKACGAKRAFWMSFMRRCENGKPSEGYARGPGHCDYGPEFEQQFRRVLRTRYDLPEEEARTCGICVVNLWTAVERPAYKDPLALLDGSSIRNMDTETIPYILDQRVDNGYGYRKEQIGKGTHERPVVERVPQSAMDAPTLSALYAPEHRWVYLPDMATEEAVIFKQYDYRKSARTKATFHTSFTDLHHEAWKECPGRRSVECRVILTFDPEEEAAAAPSAKL